jgi:hypothetical protein
VLRSKKIPALSPLPKLQTAEEIWVKNVRLCKIYLLTLYDDGMTVITTIDLATSQQDSMLVDRRFGDVGAPDVMSYRKRWTGVVCRDKSLVGNGTRRAIQGST